MLLPSPLEWRRGGTLVAALAAAAVIAACGSDQDAARDGPRVVATTTQIADFTRAVGGERVALTQLLKPNTDPHDYEPRPSDVREVAASNLVLASGAGLDDWSRELTSNAQAKARVVDLSESTPVKRAGGEHAQEGEEHGAEESEGEHADEAADPHWWHDPRNARAAVERIRGELIRIDPQGADEYRRNADAYLADVARLDAGIERCFRSVPERERKLVTDHDAVGYFADRYNIAVVGTVIPSQTTQAQASAGDIARLAKVIERERVKAIFPQSSLNPAVARALADQTGTTAEYTLYGDTLGPNGSPGATYLTMERANADAMMRGFTDGRRGCHVAGIG
jgi:ABC-type Zn uptake system ZnuABC Zn-binding protein ZnuA